MELNEIKNRFGIIGNDPRLNSAIDTAVQIAGTNLSVLITGESGVGKEVIPKIIHAFSPRKHNNYIAIKPVRTRPARVTSRRLTRAPSSWTRWESCLFPRRPGCSGSWKAVSL